MYLDDSTDKLGVVYSGNPDREQWSSEALIEVFFRLLQAGWKHRDISERTAFAYGRSLGRYGLQAIAERDAKVRELAREIVTESAAWGGGQ